jgi:dolichol-phosphate mannosyltransferase
MNKKKISIVSPCYNESQNIEKLYPRIISAISNIQEYDFEILFIDNASEDDTVDKIKSLIINDKRVKLIINIKNFGHIRSPYWGIMQANGDAVVYLASDLQDSPEYIPDFIKLWEKGWPVIMAVKEESELSYFDKKARELYYVFLEKISAHKTIKNATGFGLYDRRVIEEVRRVDDREPFFRGMVSELGFNIYQLKVLQRKREFGSSKNNLFTLYEYAIIGIVNQSIVPIRVMSIIGFITAILSFSLGVFYIVKKIIFWDAYKLGISPTLLPIFFMFGIQFIFMGIIGEYLRLLVIKAKNRPVVVEKERINF